MSKISAIEPSWQERGRLAALERYHILDTPAEADFDDIAQLASEVLEAPIAVVNLIASGRQWFKAEAGIGARELPLDVSLCAHAILQQDTMVVPDTTQDPRFSCSPLVTADGGLRFLCRRPAQDARSLPIGTVCVLDRVARPKGITAMQRRTLEVLARQVMTQLELRRALTRQREDDMRLRLIVDSAVDYGIITTDLDGLVTSWSEGRGASWAGMRRKCAGNPATAFSRPRTVLPMFRHRKCDPR